MKKPLLLMSCLCLSIFANAQKGEKTAFQTGSPWRPEIDVRSDIAIVYGAGDRHDMTFEQRVKSWRDHGYNVQFMTGIAWGSYDDYFLGKWDGKNHLGIGQVMQNGDTIWHGHNIPYVVPEATFIDYMKRGVVKKVIDAGITAIYLEEPEFWARAGYGQVFKDEWQSYYGFPWRPQHESPENTYLSSKLKYHLYYNAIKEVSSYAKAYGKTKGLDVKVFIPTHSLVNYSSWQIVSPEASLASLPGIDGYIAQVWTGTSREPTYFDGLKKERVFENAFLEYGSVISMTAPTNRKVFLLTDPIEDWPRDWSDYKRNYQATFTAKILYPMVADYEVMPWPERIYTSPYRVANSDSMVLIPKYYSTQMQVMVNALNDMPRSANKVTGVNGIGVLMGNSLMFQRFPTHNGYDDPQFSNFYGQTLPLLKLGIPVQTVHMENLSFAASLKDIRVLVMSYSNMKPMSADVHKYLAEWVKKGGILVYCSKDDDPYQSVMEWWNTKGMQYKTASAHLFSLLGVKADAGKYNIGKGKVFIIKEDPKNFVLQANGAAQYVATVKEAFGGKLEVKNNLYLERGPYDIVAVMDEVADKSPYRIKGPVVDLFDPTLPVLDEKVVEPGSQAFLYNINRIKDKTKPKVLATAARVYEEKVTANGYSFMAKSPAKTINAMRVLLPAKPKSVVAADKKLSQSWDEKSHTLYLGFDNSPDGVKVDINW
ncbi:hypothetical protein [Chitinophaga sancti]|uniref:Beta-galactosidase trimerisation domain-containing protein n=1 Tax=Chitinophaga sancti TaxID=1004 RepID=A0A1K1R7G4_9BACT|nr:hypothetical protein [Chitinophaga sancti]WQD64195.1 hypothetical protein U0033_07290 [Chitinophaga sancti]WQG90181.1 hypothetical protein SR876_01630 [Chitinophaga sancti]SFW67574.1 hypothetical protein SAMN05661012_03450 [Chitinophaga sancti]